MANFFSFLFEYSNSFHEHIESIHESKLEEWTQTKSTHWHFHLDCLLIKRYPFPSSPYMVIQLNMPRGSGSSSAS